MEKFKVKCFEVGAAKWDGIEHDIEARDEHDAAERVCGGSLVDAGKPGQLRAQVAPVRRRGAPKMFYVRD